MSAFYDNSVTDVGRLLLADIQSGAKFVPTKIVIGSGYMPQGKSTRTMTEVVEVVKELSLNKVQKTSDGSVIFGTAFSNEDILQPFYYRELGLYAKGVYYNDDGEPSNETKEVLYSYGNSGDNAELIPAYSTGSITERQLDLIVYIGNDTEVVLNIEAGTYVTMPVFKEQIENINKEIITIKADFGDIDDKIGNTTDSEATVSTGTVCGKLNSILLYLTVTLVEKLSKITEDISENKISIGSADDLSSSATIFGKLAEIKETLITKFNEVISKITEDVSENKEVMGSPEDISSSPTIFGKIADIKETLTSKFSDVDSRITGIDGKIGTTTDTGGTASAGSIFAKINKLLTDWTSTRAGRIDSIYANTETSTSSSSTGTLSQKLNYIKGLIGTSGDSGTTSVFGKLNNIEKKHTKYIEASDNVKIQFIKDTPVEFTRTDTSNSNSYIYISRFMMNNKVGTIKLKGKIKVSYISGADLKRCYMTGVSKYTPVDSSIRAFYQDVELKSPAFGTVAYDTIPVNELAKYTSVVTISNPMSLNEVYEFEIVLRQMIDNVDFFLQVYVECGSTNSTYKVSLSELNICYDELEVTE